MKKFLLALFAVIVSVALVACGDTTTQETVKVGLIVSAAGANDNGYNQFAIEGLTKAETDFGVDTHVVNNADDVPGSIETLAEDGYDLIFSLEYNFGALITDDGSGESIAEKYPDTTFVVFNAFANTNEAGEKVHDNVAEVLFNVNEGSFLAGALSVLVNENNELLFDSDDYSFTPTSESRGVGFIGGTQSDGISVFGYGFAQGVNYIAEELDVTYDIYETYSAGFAATPEIYNTIDSYFDSGVNVIFAAAGGVSTSMKNAAADNGKLSIDVDANQDASVPGSVLTSVLKNTNIAVYDLVDQFVDGTDIGGAEYFYDLNSGATGITDLATIEAYISEETSAQTKWTEIKAKIAELESAISDGTIDVIDAQAGETLDYATLPNVTPAN
ncbi:BMP family ABC transporter substrate-binding protein [Mycoplasmatota bacterium WC30]